MNYFEIKRRIQKHKKPQNQNDLKMKQSNENQRLICMYERVEANTTITTSKSSAELKSRKKCEEKSIKTIAFDKYFTLLPTMFCHVLFVVNLNVYQYF